MRGLDSGAYPSKSRKADSHSCIWSATLSMLLVLHTGAWARRFRQCGGCCVLIVSPVEHDVVKPC